MIFAKNFFFINQLEIFSGIFKEYILEKKKFSQKQGIYLKITQISHQLPPMS